MIDLSNRYSKKIKNEDGASVVETVSVLCVACANRNLKIIKLLIDAGAKYEDYNVFEVSNEKYTYQWIHRLCEKNHWDCIRYVCQLPSSQCASNVLICQNRHGESPLFVACRCSNYRSVVVLGMSDRIPRDHTYLVLSKYIGHIDKKNDWKIVRILLRILYLKGHICDWESMNSHCYHENSLCFMDIVHEIQRKTTERSTLKFVNMLTKEYDKKNLDGINLLLNSSIHILEKETYQDAYSSGTGKTETRSVGGWILGDIIGEGGFGWVQKGISKSDENNLVALKFIRKQQKHLSDTQINTEIEIYREIEHSNIIKLRSFSLNAQYPMPANI